jgi:hypothetical protein
MPVHQKYQYRRRLPHFHKFDVPLFVTFCTAGPLILPDEARDLILEHCLREHGRRVDLCAAIVMPDHVHLLFTPLRDENGWPFPLLEIMQSLKASPPTALTSFFIDPAQSGKTNPSIMCCALMKA